MRLFVYNNYKTTISVQFRTTIMVSIFDRFGACLKCIRPFFAHFLAKNNLWAQVFYLSLRVIIFSFWNLNMTTSTFCFVRQFLFYDDNCGFLLRLFWKSMSQVCPYYLPKFCQTSKNILWAQVFYHFSMVIFSFWNLNMTFFWDARPVSLVFLLCEAGGPWWLIVSHYIFDIVLEIVYPMRSRALIPSS